MKSKRWPESRKKLPSFEHQEDTIPRSIQGNKEVGKLGPYWEGPFRVERACTMKHIDFTN